MTSLRRAIAAGALLIAAAGGSALLTEPASAAPTHCTGSAVSTITNDPDSGGHGDWAVDTTFTRTTTVKADCTGVLVEDKGSFATIAGAKSPRDGVALPSTPVTGTFTGKITLTFTTPAKPGPVSLAALPKVVHHPKVSVTQTWATDLKATEDNDWTWTYTTGCQTWVDAFNNGDGAQSKGDITGKTCPVKTPPPTTTVTVPPTTVTQTAPGFPASPVTTPVAQVTAVPSGAPETGGGATAGAQVLWELYLALAILAAGGVTATVYVVRWSKKNPRVER
jgi:hypothetical protein